MVVSSLRRLRLSSLLLLGVVLPVPVRLTAQTAVELPEVTVHSPRVANQEPVVALAMPVSVLDRKSVV